jgi:fructose-1,6-bisphosphatase II
VINDPVEQLLALEMVRVTEEAAIASARAMGRGDRNGADKLATEAMRSTMEEIDFAGRIVIGEGERDEAPMLYIGEGRRGGPRAASRHRSGPPEGTNLVAHGQAGRSRSGGVRRR